MSLGLIGALVRLLEEAQVVQRTAIASAALAVYDCFLTFGDEVEYVWPSSWNYGKILYFLTRYLVFVDTTVGLTSLLYRPAHVSTCNKLITSTAWMEILGVLIAKVILILRTKAIYQNDKRIWIPLAVFFVLISAAICTTTALFIRDQQFVPLNIYPYCQGFGRSRIIWLAFIVGAIFEIVVMILTAYKACQHWRTASSPLIKVIYRDGTLFFIYLTGASLVNAILVLKAPGALANVLTSLQRVLHSTLPSRLLLNMRKAAADSYKIHLATTTTTESTGIQLTPMNDILEEQEHIRTSDETTPDSVLFGRLDSQWDVAASWFGETHHICTISSDEPLDRPP